LDDQNNNFFVGNFLPNLGHFSVTEGYAELVVPVLKGARFAKALELNAAMRATGYSISGYVTSRRFTSTIHALSRYPRSQSERAVFVGNSQHKQCNGSIQRKSSHAISRFPGRQSSPSPRGRGCQRSRVGLAAFFCTRSKCFN
jgi:hypothetical protein